ncbi:hypothetical protein DOTSEDRAFT_39613 [Dothistroma septosporum NZE10]|uniref:Uncharacterized protein n=1 Tax=Dothistroma septosporum (strain NZE10 / CBS 128990) TaxID=675120 RepID=M2XG74_DOTSN|nr:hypothetical protein DOTSEDRAFT_39613 [Dothistroma septosporum NZE10]
MREQLAAARRQEHDPSLRTIGGRILGQPRIAHPRTEMSIWHCLIEDGALSPAKACTKLFDIGLRKSIKPRQPELKLNTSGWEGMPLLSSTKASSAVLIDSSTDVVTLPDLDNEENDLLVKSAAELIDRVPLIFPKVQNLDIHLVFHNTRLWIQGAYPRDIHQPVYLAQSNAMPDETARRV